MFRWFITLSLCLLLIIPAFGKDEKKITFAIANLKAQILLDRAGFSPGQIDGGWGTNSQRAVEVYQLTHSLPTTGEMDPATWDVLTSQDTSKHLTTYVLTSTDEYGPYLEVLPTEMYELAQLESPTYSSIYDALGERFHCAPYLLISLNPGVNFITGAKIKVPNVSPGGSVLMAIDTTLAPTDRKIIITTKKCSLEIVDTTGRVFFHAPITPGGKKNPPPFGEWTVNRIVRNPAYYYNPKLFWDADKTEYRVTVEPGPRNPVGLLWINMTAKNYGIHGTPSPANIGHTVSHGCIRMTNWDVQHVAKIIKVGIPVLVKEE